MKKIIVYYSLEGNTQYIADKLSDALGAGKLRLIPEKAYADKGFAKFFCGGKSAVMAEKFVSENKELLKGRRISAFACQSGSGAEKAFGKLRSLLETDDFYCTAIFIDPKDKPSEENELRLDNFIKKLKGND